MEKDINHTLWKKTHHFDVFGREAERGAKRLMVSFPLTRETAGQQARLTNSLQRWIELGWISQTSQLKPMVIQTFEFYIVSTQYADAIMAATPHEHELKLTCPSVWLCVTLNACKRFLVQKYSNSHTIRTRSKSVTSGHVTTKFKCL